ncbi:MAG: MlaD family protein [Verrucomicrobiales bacterium]
MNPSNGKTEVLVGLFVFCGLLLLGGLILQFSNIKEVLRKDYPLKVTFRDSGGITEGSPIRYSGSKIGRVSDITPQEKVDGDIRIRTGVVVHLEIYEKVRIPKGAKVTIGKEGLLGDAYISIEPPVDPIIGVLEPNETIAGREGGGLGDLQDAATEISQKTQAALEEIRKGLVDLNNAIRKLDSDVLSEENTTHFKKTLADMNSAVEKIDARILDDENTANLKKTLANMTSASDKIAAQSARLDGIMDKGETAMTKFGQAGDSMKEGARSFSKAAETAGKTVGDMNHGKGLMSALIHDPELRGDFKNLISNLKERGVLFYKDKSEQRARVAQPPAAPPRAGRTPKR